MLYEVITMIGRMLLEVDDIQFFVNVRVCIFLLGWHCKGGKTYFYERDGLKCSFIRYLGWPYANKLNW